MDVIQTSNKHVDKFGPGLHGFNPGSPSGTPATFVSPEFFDNIQMEIVNTILRFGGVLNPASKTQMADAIESAIKGATGGDYKPSCRFTTTGNITLSGLGTQGGGDWSAPLTAGDRVLVKDNTIGSENGPYIAQAGAWIRAPEADQSGELTSGSLFIVEEGASKADSIWMLVTDGTITIGTTYLVFVQKDVGAAATKAPGEVFWQAGDTPSTGSLVADGAAHSRAAYPALYAKLNKVATVTISIATPGVVTWANHGRSANDPIKFSTTGAIPTGLVAGTTYYVVGASITTNTFQLSAAPGGAAINTSGSQSGTHTAIFSPWGDGDGSTTFNVPDVRGEFIRGADRGRGIDPNRAFGSLQLDELKSHTHIVNNAGNSAGSVDGGGVMGGTTAASQATGGAETRPRNRAMTPCIQY
jgi:phage-related tail fiber protein